MNGAVLATAGYRLRATFPRRWAGYLALVVLIGVAGGLAMGSIAAVRRTQASFPTYIASTNPSEYEALNSYLDPTIGDTAGYYPARALAIARLPHVKQADTEIGFDANLVLLSKLRTDVQPGEKPPVFEGSTNGDFLNESRVTLVAGRLADPNRLDEVVMNAAAEHELGLHLGSTARVGFGALFGLPLGIIVGRLLWILFAENIHAVPSPSVPVLTVVLIALGAIVLANFMATLPGRLAARIATAHILRAE